MPMNIDNKLYNTLVIYFSQRPVCTCLLQTGRKIETLRPIACMTVVQQSVMCEVFTTDI